MQTKNNAVDTAAFGGQGWSPRIRSHAMEIGDIWAGCGLDSEWKPLPDLKTRAFTAFPCPWMSFRKPMVRRDA